jgi:tetratricopeptide (TPR) repeat protein
MKHIQINTLIILLLAATTVFGQSEKYQQAIGKGLQQLQSAKSPDELAAAANQFERIAKAESKQWLPSYYAAYSNLISGLTGKKENMDAFLDKALVQISQAEAISPENSEIYTVKGYIEFMKMSVDPMSRMPFMERAAASLDKAIALNPENPRPYHIKGQNIFYTPAVFGGGKDAAKPLLEKAEAKFSSFKPENEVAPNWGKERNIELLAQCK